MQITRENQDDVTPTHEIFTRIRIDLSIAIRERKTLRETQDPDLWPTRCGREHRADQMKSNSLAGDIYLAFFLLVIYENPYS